MTINNISPGIYESHCFCMLHGERSQHSKMIFQQSKAVVTSALKENFLQFTCMISDGEVGGTKNNL